MLFSTLVVETGLYRTDDSKSTIRGGVETCCFETETRLWGSKIETRRDFGVPRPRQDTRLYISYFSLSQACEVRVGSWSRMLFGGLEVVF